MIGIYEDGLIELLLLLYGIYVSGEYWGVTVEYLVEEDLQMSPLILEPSLHLMVSDGEMEGVIGAYVDENLNDRTPLFEKLTSDRLKRFESKPRVYEEFNFFGRTVSTTTTGEFLISQNTYVGWFLLALKNY